MTEARGTSSVTSVYYAFAFTRPSNPIDIYGINTSTKPSRCTSYSRERRIGMDLYLRNQVFESKNSLTIVYFSGLGT